MSEVSIYKPRCLEPLLLVNKYCYTLMQHGGVAFVDGVQSAVLPPVGELLRSVKVLPEDRLAGYYVVKDGFKEPLIMYVPCTKCELCRHSKQVDLINRSILESLTWDCPPVFFTLTYREADLPCVRVGDKRYEVGELRYKDVQDFFKRLRMRWTRKGLIHDVRYLVAGEYGSRYGRCHYHVIMWNNPYHCSELDFHLFNELKLDVFEAWQHADPPAFDFGQCRGGAAPYATKYVTKPQLTHGHNVKPFIRCSSGSRGGLGSIFLQKFIPYLRSNPSINYLDYTDKDGKYCYMYFSKSITAKVWPSVSKCVPARQRELFRQLQVCLSKMVYLRLFTMDEALYHARLLCPSEHLKVEVETPKFLSPSCPIYTSFFSKELNSVFGFLTDALCEVVSDVPKDYVRSLCERRERLPKLPVVDYGTKVSKLREKHAAVAAKEVF